MNICLGLMLRFQCYYVFSNMVAMDFLFLISIDLKYANFNYICSLKDAIILLHIVQVTHIIHSYYNMLIVRIIFRHLKFSFDIGDPDDGWRELLPDLLKSCRLKDLRSADVNWTETVFKKAFVSQSTSATWSHSDLKDLTSRRRLRQRYFIRLFDLFTAVAPNMEELHLPFDWSEKSIEVVAVVVI